MHTSHHSQSFTAGWALLPVTAAIAGLALWLALVVRAEACHPVRLDALSAYGGTADHGCGGIMVRLPELPALPPQQPIDPIDPSALPPVAALAIQDLAARTGVPPEHITAVDIQEVEWPDSSLGCPQPGFLYLQVITPGYRIVLAAGGQLYEYHTDRSSRAVLCTIGAGDPQTEPASSGNAPGESEPAAEPAPDAEAAE